MMASETESTILSCDINFLSRGRLSYAMTIIHIIMDFATHALSFVRQTLEQLQHVKPIPSATLQNNTYYMKIYAVSFFDTMLFFYPASAV